MNTIDDLFQYLEALRLINSTPFYPSYAHMKWATTCMRTLYLIDPQVWDISIMSIKDKRLGDVIEMIKIENNSYIDYYSKKEEFLLEQTDYKKVYSLVEIEVDRKYYFKGLEAEREWKKYNDAFWTCNNATRLYNSMDCRPDQKEEDLQIIQKYLDELYDIVGYPVHIEKVNEEHELYRKKRREAEQRVREIASKRSEYHHELDKDIDGDVYQHIYRIVSDVAKAIENCGFAKKPPQKAVKERSKRTRQPSYNSLRESIQDDNTYNSLIRAAKGYMGEFKNKLDPQFGFYVFNLLKAKNKIDCTQELFAELLIDHFGKERSTFKPHSISSGQDRYDSNRSEWLEKNFKIE